MLGISKKRLLSLLFSFTMLLLVTACSGRPVQELSSSSQSSSQSSTSSRDTSSGANASDGTFFANPLPVPSEASTYGVADTGFTKLAQEKKQINSDTVGWLNIPETSIDDVIVWYPGDRNEYYLRRDFDKVPNTGPLASQYGSFFADYRSTFNGGGSGLIRNTVIYGHSMEDDPNGKAFSQLKKFLNEDFAKKTPYIYFSTIDEDMAWEVFAVFYTTYDLAYNRPNMTDEDFQDIIIDEVLPRSIYNYECGVTEQDKILTLSTCCYGFTSSYPNKYRYVVMAKLVPSGNVTKSEASFVKNGSVKAP